MENEPIQFESKSDDARSGTGPEDIHSSSQESQLEETEGNIVEINGKKLELGIYLGRFNFNAFCVEISKLNAALKEGENHWRMITVDEFNEISKPIREVRDDNERFTDKEADEICKTYVEKLGFEWKGDYWAGSNPSGPFNAGDRHHGFCWYSYDGYVYDRKMDWKSGCRCVREV